MKNLWKVPLILLLAAVCFTGVSCGQKSTETGLLQGAVTIGPITPVQIQGQNPPVPPEVFSSRKVLVYDSTGKNLVTQVTINQINQTADGYYTVQLEAGIYTIDVTRTGVGGGANLPKQITISAGQTTILNIDIDTGIR